VAENLHKVDDVGEASTVGPCAVKFDTHVVAE
jgi:hypothetical protein